MPTVWRITRTKHAARAFTGAGAALYGGRWNSKGQAVVYASESVALALLETVVHLPRPRRLRDHSAAPIAIPPALVETVGRLPRDWKRETPATRRIGDRWAQNGAMPALAVPSAVFGGRGVQPMNYILNPNHPEFPALAIGRFTALEIDPRIP